MMRKKRIKRETFDGRFLRDANFERKKAENDGELKETNSPPRCWSRG